MPSRALVRVAPAMIVTALCAVALGGCMAAGMASGPLVSAIQAIGERSVARTFTGDRAQVAAAVADTLALSGLEIRDTERGDDAWTVRAGTNGVSVKARLAAVTPKLTRVAVTVETGRIVADKQTSTEILNQIGAALAPRPSAPVDVAAVQAAAQAQAQALAGLRRELRSVQVDLERRDRSASPPSPSAAAVAPILVVPTSYGVPTVPVPGPTTPPLRDVPSVAAAPGSESTGQALAVARPLVPVSPLAASSGGPE